MTAGSMNPAQGFHRQYNPSNKISGEAKMGNVHCLFIAIVADVGGMISAGVAAGHREGSKANRETTAMLLFTKSNGQVIHIIIDSPRTVSFHRFYPDSLQFILCIKQRQESMKVTVL